jgi:hypothetical protein
MQIDTVEFERLVQLVLDNGEHTRYDAEEIVLEVLNVFHIQVVEWDSDMLM